jgi:hypothetical protein
MLGRATSNVALAALLLLSACSNAPAGPPPNPVTLALCGSSPQAAPDLVQVICNTDDLTARDLTWSAWGKPVATARGTATVDLCAYDDCHTGAFTSSVVVLTASKIMRCGKHKLAYANLHYAFVHGSPWPDIKGKFDTSGYISAPNRPLPPPDQTVNLTC